MNSNCKIFTNIRNEYKNFIYKSFKCNINDFCYELIYEYQIDDKNQFKHILKIKKNTLFEKGIDINNFNKIISMIGLIEGINYYKIFCCENFIVEVDQLDEYEKKWWRKTYYKGLSELLYLNNIEINEEEFINFKSTGNLIDKVTLNNLNGNLILVGGGKDSITTLELLKDENNKILIMNPRKASLKSCEIAGYKDEDIIIIDRIIDEKVFEYNKSGEFLNGHIPFSAVISFISQFVSGLIGYKNVITSNECSANEETVKGANHQYSKTFEYEKDFREYSDKYIYNEEKVNYYSLLRPLYELQIVKIFSKHEKYFNIFKSCNIGSKIIDKKEEWCCNCPKCLFVYILLLSCIDEDKVISIFGENLLNKKEMKNDFDKLIGKSPEKPFECIGTKKEVNAAMTIIINKGIITELSNYYKEECKDFQLNEKEISELMNNFNNENFLYQKDIDIIKKELVI